MVVVSLLLTARSAALEARSQLRAIRNDADGAALLDDATVERLDAVETKLDSATAKLDSPLVAPLRVLPVVGRQIRSADALLTGANDVAGASRRALIAAQALVDDAHDSSTDRVGLLQSLSETAATAREEISGIDPGPAQALFGSLRRARQEFVDERNGFVQLLDGLVTGTNGLATMLDGPGCYLLFAANNAEMRAGSGMFLQAGEMCFDAGSITLGDMTPTGELELDPGEVQITDSDLAARWGVLMPNVDFRNLGLSPRFPASAELGAAMWEQATGRTVDGVVAVDPLAVAAILDATGPLTVDGKRYGAGNVVHELLVGQYQDFLDNDYDAEARKRTLGEVAAAAFDALDSGRWNTADLIRSLPMAAAGRHVLAWSRDAAVQRSLERMHIAGVLEPDSLAVSLLNRGGGHGGGKLDPAMRVEATLALVPGNGSVKARLDIGIDNTSEPGQPTYTESPDLGDTTYGLYQGILTINVPGTALDTRIDGVDGLYVVGSDGPTRVVGTRFELDAGQHARFVVRFTLPDTFREITIEPSARQPPIVWNVGDRRFRDENPRKIHW